MLRLANRPCLRGRLFTLAANTQRFKSIVSGQPFEEEQLPWYAPDQFYPVRIGELLNFRYKVVGKLGYGAHSTAWLCRDTRCAHTLYSPDFVSIKVCTRNTGPSVSIRREVQFYEHVASLNSHHPGQAFIRGLFETFEIEGPGGQHLCLVQPPMHMTIHEFQRLNSSHCLNERLLKWTLSNVLKALSFLHDEARVVHTGNINATILCCFWANGHLQILLHPTS